MKDQTNFLGNDHMHKIFFNKKSLLYLSVSIITIVFISLGIGHFITKANNVGPSISGFSLSNVTVSTISGNAPFDKDNDPGHDTDSDNDIIRSFDRAQYDMQFSCNVPASSYSYKSFVFKITGTIQGAYSSDLNHDAQYMSFDYQSDKLVNNAIDPGVYNDRSKGTTTVTREITVPYTDGSQGINLSPSFGLYLYGASNGLKFAPRFTIQLVSAVDSNGVTHDALDSSGNTIDQTINGKELSVSSKVNLAVHNRNSSASNIAINRLIGLPNSIDPNAVLSSIGFSIGLAPLSEHNSHDYYLSTYPANGKLRGVAFPEPDKPIQLSFDQQILRYDDDNATVPHSADTGLSITGATGSSAGWQQGMRVVSLGSTGTTGNIQSEFNGIQATSINAHLPSYPRNDPQDSPPYSYNGSILNNGTLTVDNSTPKTKLTFDIKDWQTNDFWADLSPQTLPFPVQSTDAGTIDGVTFLRPFISFGANLYMPYGDPNSSTTSIKSATFNLLKPTITYVDPSSSMSNSVTFDTSTMNSQSYTNKGTPGIIQVNSPQYETSNSYFKNLKDMSILSLGFYEDANENKLIDNVFPNDHYDYDGIATTYMGANILFDDWIQYDTSKAIPDHTDVVQAWNPNESTYSNSTNYGFGGVIFFDGSGNRVSIPYKLGVKKDRSTNPAAYSISSLLAVDSSNNYDDYTWYDSYDAVPSEDRLKISAVKANIPQNNSLGYTMKVSRQVIATYDMNDASVNRTGNTNSPYVTITKVFAFPGSSNANPTKSVVDGTTFTKTEYHSKTSYTPQSPRDGTIVNSNNKKIVTFQFGDSYPGATLQVVPITARTQIFTDRSATAAKYKTDLGSYSAIETIPFTVNAKFTSNSPIVQNTPTTGTLTVNLPKGINVDPSSIKVNFKNGGTITSGPTLSRVSGKQSITVGVSDVKATTDGSGKDDYTFQLTFNGLPDQFNLNYNGGKATVDVNSAVDTPSDTSLTGTDTNGIYHKFKEFDGNVVINSIGQLAAEKYYPGDEGDNDDSQIDKVIDTVNSPTDIYWIIKIKNITASKVDANVFDYLPDSVNGSVISNNSSLFLYNILGSSGTFWYTTDKLPTGLDPNTINPDTDVWNGSVPKSSITVNGHTWSPTWHNGTIPTNTKVTAIFGHVPSISPTIQLADMPTIKLKMQLVGQAGDQYRNYVSVSSGGTKVNSNISTISVDNRIVEGKVFDDVNKNGVMDSTESGIEGIKVAILDIYNNLIAKTTTTDSNGHYKFESVPKGVGYRVAFDRSTFKGYYISPVGNSTLYPNNSVEPSSTKINIGSSYNISNTELATLNDPVSHYNVYMGLIDQLSYLDLQASPLYFGKHKVPSSTKSYDSVNSTTGSSSPVPDGNKLTIIDHRVASTNIDNAPAPYQITAKMQSWKTIDTGVVGLQNSKIQYYPVTANPATNGTFTDPVAIAPPTVASGDTFGTEVPIYQRGDLTTGVTIDNTFNLIFNNIKLEVPGNSSGVNDVDAKKYQTKITYTLKNAP